MVCLRLQIRSVRLHVFIGLALVVSLIVFTYEGAYIKQKYSPRFKASAGENFSDHALFHASTSGNQTNHDKPGTPESKQSPLNDKSAINNGAISSNKVPSKTNLYNAYGHIKTIVFFFGYPRSRHTLLGSLLDAHPHMVIADETGAFTEWSTNANKWMKNSIYPYYDLMLNAARRVVKSGRRSQVSKQSVVNATRNYLYHVPNQWQGKFDQYIEIIGDKTGATAALTMKRSVKAVDDIHRLETTAGAKVRIIHVVRNPFDNIATMVLRNPKVRARYGEHKVKVNDPIVLQIETQNYFEMAEGCNKAREAFPSSVIDVPSMEIVKNPVETLRRICQFLEITCTEQYLKDCAATVDPVPSITRDFIEWTAEQKSTVYEMMKKYPFFEGYSFDK